MQLFYSSDINENDSSFSFSKDESKHIVKVLRKQTGDTLAITNGKGVLFYADILSPDAKKCTVQITSTTKQLKPEYELHLAVAPTKMNDRYEWFLEKATEIGITSITPIICDRSERKVIKEDRFQKILQSGMKQSLNYYLPILHPAISFKEYIIQDFIGAQFIAHCETNEIRKSLKKELQPKTNTTILIGPEGDFSSNEIALAMENRFTPVTLGNSRLRTETAAIVACHSVAFVNEII